MWQMSKHFLQFLVTFVAKGKANPTLCGWVIRSNFNLTFNLQIYNKLYRAKYSQLHVQTAHIRI